MFNLARIIIFIDDIEMALEDDWKPIQPSSNRQCDGRITAIKKAIQTESQGPFNSAWCLKVRVCQTWFDATLVNRFNGCECVFLGGLLFFFAAKAKFFSMIVEPAFRLKRGIWREFSNVYSYQLTVEDRIELSWNSQKSWLELYSSVGLFHCTVIGREFK